MFLFKYGQLAKIGVFSQLGRMILGLLIVFAFKKTGTIKTHLLYGLKERICPPNVLK